MKYFQDRDSGRVYGSDNFGKNKLQIVNGERCVIPVCEIPAGVVRLDCADEDVWKLVEAGASGVAQVNESKGVVLLRNPSGKSQTFRASLADLLEMPTSRRSDRVAAVSKAYGHDVSFGNPDSVGQTVEFKLGPFGMTVLNVEIGR